MRAFVTSSCNRIRNRQQLVNTTTILVVKEARGHDYENHFTKNNNNYYNLRINDDDLE